MINMYLYALIAVLVIIQYPLTNNAKNKSLKYIVPTLIIFTPIFLVYFLENLNFVLVTLLLITSLFFYLSNTRILNKTKKKIM